MKSQIKIFETGIEDGIFSRNKKFYSENLSQEEIDEKFLNTRRKLGQKYYFNGKRIFQALQKKENSNEYPNGKYIILTSKNMNSEDYWYEKLPADILIITKEYSEVVLGNQMADCPVMIAEDRRLGVTAVAHCGATYIDRFLPQQTIQALQTEFSSNLEDIYVTIGSCAKKETYKYNKYPDWATNQEVWENSIIKKETDYHIDLDKAITEQLQKIGIQNIECSTHDTITDPYFYSHSALFQGINKNPGQNFVGFYYPKEKGNAQNKKNS